MLDDGDLYTTRFSLYDCHYAGTNHLSDRTYYHGPADCANHCDSTWKRCDFLCFGVNCDIHSLRHVLLYYFRHTSADHLPVGADSYSSTNVTSVHYNPDYSREHCLC